MEILDSFNPMPDRTEIVLIGTSEKEFEVYAKWLTRHFGPSVRVSRSRANGAVPDADIILADLDGSARSRAAIDIPDDRPLITVSDAANGAAENGNGALPVAHLCKPLSRVNFVKAFQAAIKSLPSCRPRRAPSRSLPAVDVMAGTSSAIAALRVQIDRLAGSLAPVFIAGEPGAGKAACAQAIHAASSHRDGPFVALDLSTMDASRQRRALFLDDNGGGAMGRADGGTLFLDQVQTLAPDAQAQLLAALATGSITDDGRHAKLPAPVRILTAAPAIPARATGTGAASGGIREDLYYRLFVLPIAIPPLRARREDIAPLAKALLARISAEERRRFAALADDAEAALATHNWPGNLRELEATIRQTVVLNDARVLTAAMLPVSLRTEKTGAPQAVTPANAPASLAEHLRDIESTVDGIAPMWLQEQRIIEMALAACEGHVGRAAEALKISPSTIYRKIQSWQDRAVA